MLKNKPKTSVFLMSYTETPGVDPLLLVSKKAAGTIPEIINAISGARATELYKELTINKGGMKDD